MGASRVGAKLLLLLWKNWKLQARHPLQTLVEVLVPVVFAVVVVVVRSLTEPTTYAEVTRFPAFEPVPTALPNISLPDLPAGVIPKIEVAWSARDSSSDAFTEEAQKVMEAAFPTKLIIPRKFKSEAELENYYMQNSNLGRVVEDGDTIFFAGVVFEDTGGNESPELCSEELKVKIRFPAELRTVSQNPSPTYNWRTQLLFPFFQMTGPREKEEIYGPAPPYYKEGFLAVQSLVSQAVIIHCYTKKGNDILFDLQSERNEQEPNNLFSLKVKRFSYPEYVDDQILTALESAVSTMIMLGFVYTCIVTIKVVTTEKETQVKEAMKIMGLPTALHWIAWFTKTMSILLITVALITVLFKIEMDGVAVFTHCSGTVLFIFFVIYMMATTFFCFMVSVFFSKANTAATVGGLVYFLTYVPYSFLTYEYETMSLSEKLLSCLSFNSAMGFAFRVMVMYEGIGDGLQWSTLWTPATQDDNLTMGHIFIILLVDCCIYMIIALYVEAVFPGDYGVPKPWYFPVQKSFWCGVEQQSATVEQSSVPTGPNFEREPLKTNAGVKIRNLRKVFSGDKVAVDNLTLNMYEGQITVLLGHNGAGKTTTMSMLTGVYTPTSGTALVNGYDIVTDIDAARDSLGLCPQHNILFDELTVREHLYFFGKLKGLSGAELESEIKKYIKLLQLEDKEHKQSRTLSGGMKRKLNAAVALCGKSKVVMFDEPTSGMDPAARRALWDLLREEKEGRTILLTTHFMDEADLLGDRIAIMAGGRLQCSGSPFFLKKRFGAGYRLVVVKGPRCSASAVTEVLSRHLPGIEPAQDVGSELSYQLDEAQAAKFEPMLKELEQRGAALDVLSYGVSLTTMEEVFMKVGKDHEVSMENGHYQYSKEELSPRAVAVDVQKFVFTGDAPADSTEGPVHAYTVQMKNSGDMLTGAELIVNQLKAMFIKKALALYRNWLLLLIHCLLPIIFLVMAILIGRTFEIVHTSPPREMNLQDYSEPKTVAAVLNGTDQTTNIYRFLNIISQNYINITGIVSDSRTRYSGGNVEETFEDYLLEEYKKDLAKERNSYIVGATFNIEGNKPTIIGWFNDQPLHAVPLALNLLYNAILKVVEVSINLINHPLPFTAESQMQMLQNNNNMGFQIAFNVGFSMAFVSAFYILFPTRERISKSKHLQFVSGANVIVFWMVHFICDYLSYLIPSLGFMITLACFQEEGFSSFEELGRVFTVLLCFGWSMLPFLYLSSFFFSIPASGYTRISIFNIFVGNAGIMIVTILKMPGIDQETVSDVLQWILMIIPHYSVVDAINNINTYYTYKKICSSIVTDCSIESVCCPDNCPESGCVSDPPDYFQIGRPGIGRNIIFLLCSGCLYIVLLLLVEFRLFNWLRSSQCTSKSISPSDPNDNQSPSFGDPTNEEDSDVLQEKKRIRTSDIMELTKKFSLVMRDVTKFYGKFMAVDHLCIGVERGECFGLLGVNGAGKTTTFKMMTGDERISSGSAFLEGLNLKENIKEVHKLIGYCPQFDALIEELTGRETLRVFCLLRGIPADQIPRITQELADELLFTKHIDKKVKEYSGGNKRKLSTAVALVGDPPVVFLDEPTTGMDPVAKRHLWNVICKIRDKGKSIILTSHSMEECEALCTRLVIMVNGKFKCLGSTQHLKNKFAEGFTLIIKVSNPPSSLSLSRQLSISSNSSSTPDLTAVKNFIYSSFQGAVLTEEYMGLLTYYIPNSNFTWSQMFGMMERAKAELNIEDYSLGQTSLEQVFLNFTKFQKEEPTTIL